MTETIVASYISEVKACAAAISEDLAHTQD
jgi:hypothetical protein